MNVRNNYGFQSYVAVVILRSRIINVDIESCRVVRLELLVLRRLLLLLTVLLEQQRCVCTLAYITTTMIVFFNGIRSIQAINSVVNKVVNTYFFVILIVRHSVTYIVLMCR